MKKASILLLFITSSLFSMQLDRVSYADNPNKMYIPPFSVKVPEKLGSLDLYHSKKGFYVRQDDKKYVIKKYFTDPMLQGITKRQLQAFLTGGYLAINQMDDGEYLLRAKGRIVGGGPILGTIAYWVTKSLCYGTAVAAVGTVAVAGGGALGAATGIVAHVGGATVLGTAATTTIVGTATTGVITTSVVSAGVVTGGAGIVSAGIVGGGLAGEAALATAGVVSSAGGIGATIAGVEALSAAVGTFFGMLPTP